MSSVSNNFSIPRTSEERSERLNAGLQWGAITFLAVGTITALVGIAGMNHFSQLAFIATTATGLGVTAISGVALCALLLKPIQLEPTPAEVRASDQHHSKGKKFDSPADFKTYLVQSYPELDLEVEADSHYQVGIRNKKEGYSTEEHQLAVCQLAEELYNMGRVPLYDAIDFVKNALGSEYCTQVEQLAQKGFLTPDFSSLLSKRKMQFERTALTPDQASFPELDVGALQSEVKTREAGQALGQKLMQKRKEGFSDHDRRIALWQYADKLYKKDQRQLEFAYGLVEGAYVEKDKKLFEHEAVSILGFISGYFKGGIVDLVGR